MQDKDTKEEKKDSTKLVGENTYGLGVMAKYSWTLVLSITAGLTLVGMTIFRPGKEGWQNRENLIKGIRWLPDSIRKQTGEFSDSHDHRLLDAVPVAGASFLLATIIKHALQVPAFVKGRREARRVNEKYATVVDENAVLVQKLAKYEGNETQPQLASAAIANASTQKPPTESKSGEVPPLRFVAENKPTDSHVAAVQDSKGNSSLMGTGV